MTTLDTFKTLAAKDRTYAQLVFASEEAFQDYTSFVATDALGVAQAGISFAFPRAHPTLPQATTQIAYWLSDPSLSPLSLQSALKRCILFVRDQMRITGSLMAWGVVSKASTRVTTFLDAGVLVGKVHRGTMAPLAVAGRVPSDPDELNWVYWADRETAGTFFETL